MKLEPRQISLLLIATYICLAVPIVYSIFEFPSQIANSLGLEMDSVESVIREKVNRIIFYIVVELSIGAFGVFYLVRHLVKKVNDIPEFVDESKNEDIISAVTREKVKKETFEEIENEKIRLLKKSLEDEIQTELSVDAFLKVLAKYFEVCQAAYYTVAEKEGEKYLVFDVGYAYHKSEKEKLEFVFGEGISGQAAKSQRILSINSVPDNYIKVFSGLGEASPNHLLIIPIIENGETTGLLELASFKNHSTLMQEFIRELAMTYVFKLTNKTDV